MNSKTKSDMLAGKSYTVAAGMNPLPSGKIVEGYAWPLFASSQD
jgi:hypothetical protein